MIDPITAGAMASGTVIQTISDIYDVTTRVHDSTKTSSLVEFTSAARVEPLTIISGDCIHLEYIPEVLQSLQSIFTGYYLQAVALTAQIGNIKVIRTLDRLNPSRSGGLGSFSKENRTDDWMLRTESFKFELPKFKPNDTDDDKNLVKNADNLSASTIDNRQIDKVVDLTNLSVGKLISVTINSPDGLSSVNIPISIRLMVSQVSDVSIAHLLTIHHEDASLTERYHAWRSGRITFIKDLIFCQDLITEHKRALMKDKDGTYSEIIRRVNNNKRSGLATNNPSLAMASNLFVISEAVALQVEMKMGGKLSNPRIRQKIFDTSYIMIMVVIDRQWERVTFYHRGIAAPTQVGLRDMKMSSKGTGPDIGDILKAYSVGAAPSL